MREPSAGQLICAAMWLDFYQAPKGDETADQLRAVADWLRHRAQVVAVNVFHEAAHGNSKERDR